MSVYVEGGAGSITNMILRRLLWQRYDSPCKAKIVTSSTTAFLFISNPPTAEHHSKEKGKAVYLLYEEKTFVKRAAKNQPMHWHAIYW